MKYINAKLPLIVRLMLMAYQLILMVCLLDMLEMLKTVPNTTRMHFPTAKLPIVHHIDQYNCFYQTLIMMWIVLLGLTNSIILEASTWFPLGCLIGDLLHCCWCLTEFPPHVFDGVSNSVKTYGVLHDNRPLIYGAFTLFIP